MSGSSGGTTPDRGLPLADELTGSDTPDTAAFLRFNNNKLLRVFWKGEKTCLRTIIMSSDEPSPPEAFFHLGHFSNSLAL